MRPLFRGVPIQYELLRMTFDLQQYWSPPFMEINQGLEEGKAKWTVLIIGGFMGLLWRLMQKRCAGRGRAWYRVYGRSVH